MRKSLSKIVLALAVIAPLAAWTINEQALVLQPASKLWVEGGSTIKGWSCKAADVDASIVASNAGAVPLILKGDKAVKSVDVTVTSEKLDCGNGTMNDHMKEALKVKEFPTIAFHVADYDIAKGAEGVSGTLNGTLTLGGVKKQIAVTATGTEEAGALHVVGTYDLNMKDYELKPPSLMFGRIKVREVVTVKFDLLLKN
jgi:polyisoprenoid-binding protein YceI